MKSFNRAAQFSLDNDWGNFGEGVMIRFIEDTFKKEDKFVSYWYSVNDITKKKSDFKKWDLRFGCYMNSDRINYYDKFEVEVKTDGYEKNTGNLIFEKSCGKKSSGVFATEAKYFVYFLPLFNQDNVYLIKSEDLKKLLKKFDNCIVQGGDPGSNTFMYKISRIDFDSEFKAHGGKIMTYTSYTIPERFNKTRFEQNDKYTSYGSELKEYEDPFNFGEK
jgi:hypothetical protein